MTPDLNQIDFLKVLFWVVVVLVAGFIGQFGKSFARYIMGRFGKKPPRPAGPEGVDHVENGQKQRPAEASPPGPSLTKEESKIRKKERKAELKRRKKEEK